MHAQAETNLGFSIAGMQVNDQNCAILNDVLDLLTVRSEIAEKNFTKIVTPNMAIGIKA